MLNHNLGNTSYRIGEKLNNLDKLDYWQKSLHYYANALSIRYDEETKKNYDFVLEKLKKLKDEMKRHANTKNQDVKDKNTTKKEDGNSKEGEDDSKKDDNPRENDIYPKGPSLKISDDIKKITKPLSKEEKKQIEEYLKLLREEEKQNIWLNKPKKDRDIFDILEEDFFTPLDKKENDW